MLKAFKIRKNTVLVFLYIITFKLINMKIFYYVWKNVYFCQFFGVITKRLPNGLTTNVRTSKVAPIDSQWSHIVILRYIHGSKKHERFFFSIGKNTSDLSDLEATIVKFLQKIVQW